MTNDPFPMGKKAFAVNGRVVMILAGLILVICGSVIVTDTLSRRDRTAPATRAATMSAPAGTTSAPAGPPTTTGGAL